MQRSCIRCLSTSARSLVSQASSSSSSSFALPEHLQNGPVVPELKHVEPKLRELLRRPLQHAAVFYGNDPDKIFDDHTPPSSVPSSSTFPDFGKIAADVNPNSSFSASSSSSSSSEPPVSPPALPTVDRVIEIPPLEDPLLSFMTNLMMKDGKKARARKHLSLLLETLRLRSSALPLQQLRKAIQLAAPSIRLTQQKKGGKQVAVPIALGERQRVHKAIKWILEASDKRKNPNSGGSKKFGERVALEVEAVLNGTSDVLKKKEQLHVTATVSRANVNAGSRR